MAFLIEISDKSLDTQRAVDFVQDASVGGIAVFIGTVRNQTQSKEVIRLEFEAYEPMALKEMQKIADAAAKKWDVKKMAFLHRVGVLDVGEIPVVIAVSTAHRKAAFEACQYAIDILKETVPIWKKEFFEDGAVWVAAHP